MAVLAFDTATAATVVGLLEAGGALTEARHDPPPGARPEHAQRLLPLVHQVVEDWDAVERIGVGRGPGSFTGLRIGLGLGALPGLVRSMFAMPIPVCGGALPSWCAYGWPSARFRGRPFSHAQLPFGPGAQKVKTSPSRRDVGPALAGDSDS